MISGSFSPVPPGIDVGAVAVARTVTFFAGPRRLEYNSSEACIHVAGSPFMIGLPFNPLPRDTRGFGLSVLVLFAGALATIIAEPIARTGVAALSVLGASVQVVGGVSVGSATVAVPADLAPLVAGVLAAYGLSAIPHDQRASLQGVA